MTTAAAATTIDCGPFPFKFPISFPIPIPIRSGLGPAFRHFVWHGLSQLLIVCRELERAQRKGVADHGLKAQTMGMPMAIIPIDKSQQSASIHLQFMQMEMGYVVAAVVGLVSCLLCVCVVLEPVLSTICHVSIELCSGRACGRHSIAIAS